MCPLPEPDHVLLMLVRGHQTNEVIDAGLLNGEIEREHDHENKCEDAAKEGGDHLHHTA